MATQNFKRGDFVRYGTPRLGYIEAIVRRAHRDGSYTVEATFSLNAKGERDSGYNGYRYRLHGSDIESAKASS